MKWTQSNDATVVLKQQIQAGSIKDLISFREFELVELPEEMLMEHHVVEVVDDLVQVIQLFQTLTLGFESLTEFLILVFLVLDVTTLLKQAVTVLGEVN
jgi:hypothetical protein